MGTFTETIAIRASLPQVWQTLADIGSIHEWNPGVTASHIEGEAGSGLGARRHCDLGGNNYLKESVVSLSEHQHITMRIDETNLPFTHADIRFDLDAAGTLTIVSVTPLYAVKYGVVGRLIDRVAVRRTYRRGMANLLRGLKQHVEAAAA